MFGGFRATPPSPGDGSELERVLERLEESDARAPAVRAALLNRAGNLALHDDADPRAALAWFGRAIDAYLACGDLPAAAALCRKVLRLADQPVRPYCTLACLALTDPALGDPARALDDYVRATRTTGTHRYAIPRLRLIGASAAPAVQAAVAGALEALGDAAGGAALRAAAGDAGGRWRDGRRDRQRLLGAAAADPRDLWVRAWISLPEDPEGALPAASTEPETFAPQPRTER
jgi:hypothetical protein